MRNDCAKSGFGIKAKHRPRPTPCWPIVQRADLESRQSRMIVPGSRLILCKERIWNQGKAKRDAYEIQARIVQRADLESRQSYGFWASQPAVIVQRADLESRQSFSGDCPRRPRIVQRADLESRQSRGNPWKIHGILCKERIWNQGKAEIRHAGEVRDCAKSGFGIKAVRKTRRQYDRPPLAPTPARVLV